MHTHTYTHAHTRACARTYIHMHVHARKHTCTCTHIHTCTYTHRHTHARTHVHIHTLTHTYVHTCADTYAHMCTHTHKTHAHARTCTHIHMHTCAHTHTLARVHMHTDTHTCTRVHREAPCVSTAKRGYQSQRCDSKAVRHQAAVLLEHRKGQSAGRSVASDSCDPGAVAARLLCPWESPGKSPGAGGHSLLQGIFPTHGSNPGLPHCSQILYHLNHQGSPRPQKLGHFKHHSQNIDLGISGVGSDCFSQRPPEFL